MFRSYIKITGLFIGHHFSDRCSIVHEEDMIKEMRLTVDVGCCCCANYGYLYGCRNL